ncbi:hypothetical protein PG997_014263 [Apiospora hydei]|uniref:Uncharacterized protein n=1 Tax=Apiospora hydei TaxID=1337664 RepID=A0ABR1UVR6_9PEZI
MSVLANHQRLAHVSRISQRETLAIPARPAAAVPTAATTTATTTRARNKANKKNKKNKTSRRKRAKSAAAAAAPQSPKQVTPSSAGPAVRSGGDANNNNNNEEDDDDDDGFWSPPTSPLEEFPRYHRVATDIRMSLLGPDPALGAGSDEFKRQAKEIKKDLQRLSRYARRQHSNPATLAEYSRLQLGPSSPPPPPTAPAAASAASVDVITPSSTPTALVPAPVPQQALAALQREHEFRRRFSEQEGRDFLADFLRVHFAPHRDAVAIRRRPAKTLEEIKMIGNEEDVAAGVRQCRRLFNAPVLSDRVGSLLYEELRQGAELDHSHEWWRLVTSDEDDDADDENGVGGGVRLNGDEDEHEHQIEMGRSREKKRKKRKKELPAPEELRRRREDNFERSKAEFIEMRELAAAADVSNGNGNGNGSAAVCTCAQLGGPWAGQAASMFGCIACSPPPPGGRSSVPNLGGAGRPRLGRAVTQSLAAAVVGEIDEAELFDPSWREVMGGGRKSVDGES